MGGGSSKMPSTPKVETPEVAAVEVPAPMPTSVDEGVKQAGDDKRRQLASATGKSNTILTSASGLSTKANTDKKTLLGG